MTMNENVLHSTNFSNWWENMCRFHHHRMDELILKIQLRVNYSLLHLLPYLTNFRFRMVWLYLSQSIITIDEMTIKGLKKKKRNTFETTLDVIQHFILTLYKMCIYNNTVIYNLYIFNKNFWTSARLQEVRTNKVEGSPSNRFTTTGRLYNNNDDNLIYYNKLVFKW